MSLHKARIKSFEDILEQDVIDMDQLQKFAFNGIPDDKGLRSLVWRILLHYLPQEKNARESTLLKKRQLYKQFIGNYIRISILGVAVIVFCIVQNVVWPLT